MADNFDSITDKRNKDVDYAAIPVISYAELISVINRWLLIIDQGLVKVVLSVIIANRIPSDSVWLFLIAPSGGGKSEIMAGLLKSPEYYSLSQLTPNTFLSGYKSKEKEPSLLKRLGSGVTIGFKDFTSLLDGNKDDLKDIMGQFRQIYDQYMTKVTGTGDEIVWRGRIGFIAGTTSVIEQRMSMIGALGERFLNYKIQQPPRAAMRAKVRENIGKEDIMRNEIQNAFAGYLKGVSIPQILPVIPETIHTSLEMMADFVAISRAVVMRAQDSKQEINYIVEPEMSSRIYKQLHNVALSLLIINNGEWKEEDNYILKRLALSSIHSIRWNIIKCIASYQTQVKTSTIATELGYPTSTTRRYLEDLSAISMDDGHIKILRREHQGKGKPDLWNITDEMKAILAGMGEVIEATKSDTGFEQDEEEIPVGTAVAGNGLAPEEMKEYEEVISEPKKFGLL